MNSVLRLAALLAGAGCASTWALEPVKTASRPLSEVVVYPEREAPARVVSLNETRLAAQVSARVASTHAEVGQTVARGAVLVRLDDIDLRLALERARAQAEAARARLGQAQAQLERARGLRERNFISPEALTQRETELAVARADLRVADNAVDLAQREVDKCQLRAPFDAVVKSRDAAVGSLAAPGTELVVLVDARRIELSAQIPPADLASLRERGTARFVHAGQQYETRLLRSSPLMNEHSRTVEARLGFSAAAAPSGADGRLLWRDPRAHLPAELVVRRGAQLGVFAAEQGRSRFVPLPLAQEGRPAPVNLPPDTRVVTDGRHSLQDGMALPTR